MRTSIIFVLIELIICSHEAYLENVYKIVSLKLSRIKRTLLDEEKLSRMEMNSVFGISRRNGYLEETNSLVTKKGTRRIKLNQMLNTLPIYATGCTVEIGKEGQAMGVASGAVVRGTHRDVKPSDFRLSDKKAIQILKDLKGHSSKTHTFTREKAMKMVFLKEGEMWAIWRVDYMANANDENSVDERPFALIFDHNSTVIMQWAGLNSLTVDAVGGNLLTGLIHHQLRDVFHDTHKGRKVCYYKNSKVEVMDMQGSLPAHSLDFLVRGFPCDAANDSNDFDNTEDSYSPLNDIFTYATYTYDMFMETVGRALLGSSSLGVVKIRGHVKRCHIIANWDGEYVNIGDGCDDSYPLSSDDIIAHEIAHYFTELNSNLNYYQQSGGINEAFSDITAVALKYYYRLKMGQPTNTTSLWVIGSKVYKTNITVRYMCDPKRDGISIERVSEYGDHCRPHWSSGVFNKAFCILANKPGWDPLKGFKVFAVANMMEWTIDSTFHCAACGLINAAVTVGLAPIDVRDALSEVGAYCHQCPGSRLN